MVASSYSTISLKPPFYAHGSNRRGFIGYIPNTDLMDSGFDYARMFIVKDQLCDGTEWHVRTAPANPAVDPYFPIGQAALSLFAEAGAIKVVLITLTPNFDRYEVRINAGGWKASEDTFLWSLHGGQNRLEARTLNLFGVSGPVSAAEIEMKE